MNPTQDALLVDYQKKQAEALARIAEILDEIKRSLKKVADNYPD